MEVKLTNKYLEILCSYPNYELLSYKVNNDPYAKYNLDGYYLHVFNNEAKLYIDYNNFNFNKRNFIHKNELISKIEKLENRKIILNKLLKKYN